MSPARCSLRSLRRICSFLAITLAVGSVGCARNGTGTWQPSLPWTRQPYTAQANPWQNQPYTPSPATATQVTPPTAIQTPEGLAFFRDLMRRADQQESLAERQRKQLEELSKVQGERAQQARDFVIAQREKDRAKVEQEMLEKERILAAREKKYRDQFDKIRDRASNLDSNNRDLYSELARQQKDNKLLEDELNLLKQRLSESTQQLELAQRARVEQSKQVQALQASASQQRGKAAIRANRSVTRPITAVTVPGMDVRQDGDLVRISIPSDKLFRPATATLHQGAVPYMDQIANVLRQHYPDQIAGVEAHTDHDASSLANSRWRNHHQLTAAQSMAVFEQLISRNISPNQLFVLGHGGNHPLVSGGTWQGQAVNRRIEVVIYPETYGRR